MPTFDIIKEKKINNSFRVMSIKGKFDISHNKIKETFSGNINYPNDWSIGIIYGNSGTGKTTIAKKVFKDDYVNDFKYKSNSVVDDMPKKCQIDEIVKMFNSVGFSSPPSWLKPYSVLSNGEKMRVDLANALLSEKEIIVFDEYTSVVDRNIAKIGSMAIQKTIKKNKKKKFIAISCHKDIIKWLNPDWVFNTNIMKNEYTRGRLQQFKLDIKKEKGRWELFRKYHYLDDRINNSGDEYVGYVNDESVSFLSVLHFPHPKVKNMKRVHRLVVLPDYQGVGIGVSMIDYIADIYINKNYRFTITTSNPALNNSFKLSDKWILKRYGRVKDLSKSSGIKKISDTISKKRNTASWEYIN